MNWFASSACLSEGILFCLSNLAHNLLHDGRLRENQCVFSDKYVDSLRNVRKGWGFSLGLIDRSLYLSSAQLSSQVRGPDTYLLFWPSECDTVQSMLLYLWHVLLCGLQLKDRPKDWTYCTSQPMSAFGEGPRLLQLWHEQKIVGIMFFFITQAFVFWVAG